MDTCCGQPDADIGPCRGDRKNRTDDGGGDSVRLFVRRRRARSPVPHGRKGVPAKRNHACAGRGRRLAIETGHRPEGSKFRGIRRRARERSALTLRRRRGPMTDIVQVPPHRPLRQAGDNRPDTERRANAASGVFRQRLPSSAEMKTFQETGAVEKTRTSTGVTPQRPQRCASTNSATTANCSDRIARRAVM